MSELREPPPLSVTYTTSDNFLVDLNWLFGKKGRVTYHENSTTGWWAKATTTTTRKHTTHRPPFHRWEFPRPTSRLPGCTLCWGWSPAQGTRVSHTASTSGPWPALQTQSRWFSDNLNCAHTHTHTHTRMVIQNMLHRLSLTCFINQQVFRLQVTVDKFQSVKILKRQ